MSDDDRLPQMFRRVFTYGYYFLCAGFVFCVSFSATYGAFRSYEDPNSAAPLEISLQDADGQKCASDLDALLLQLHRSATNQFGVASNKEAMQYWTQLSEAWRRKLTILKAHCHLKTSRAMKALLDRSKHVERIHMAYDTGLRAFFKVAHKSAVALEKPSEQPSP
jgi:hypothetical protein